MKKNHSLKEHNTMSFDIVTRYFYEINSLRDIDNCIEDLCSKTSGNTSLKDVDMTKRIFLGGGSNILFKEEYFDGIVIHSNLKGHGIIEETDEEVIIRCMSGEIWKDFVDYTVREGYYGLENLVDIPGSVGAAPIQNIGAYGVEVKDCIDYIYTIDINNGSRRAFSKEECNFAYRDSIFKQEEYKKYFIVAIDFKLKKKGSLKLDYGNIKEYLAKNNISSPTLSDVANAIKNIRAEKLPEVGVVGSVGSFFQNPIVDTDIFQDIKERYPDVPSYPNERGVKIPAGWLIDRAGWKGHKENHVGVWDKQALVLVHYGGGKPEEIIELMKKIQDSVKEKFGIEINPEVNIV